MNNYIKELDDKIENLRDLLDQSRSNEDDLKLTIDKLNANIINLNDLYIMSENENDSNKEKIIQLDSNLKEFINRSTCQSIIETLISTIESKAILDTNAVNIDNLQGQFNSQYANKQNEMSKLNDLNNKLKKKLEAISIKLSDVNKKYLNLESTNSCRIVLNALISKIETVSDSKAKDNLFLELESKYKKKSKEYTEKINDLNQSIESHLRRIDLEVRKSFDLQTNYNHLSISNTCACTVSSLVEKIELHYLKEDYEKYITSLNQKIKLLEENTIHSQKVDLSSIEVSNQINNPSSYSKELHHQSRVEVQFLPSSDDSSSSNINPIDGDDALQSSQKLQETERVYLNNDDMVIDPVSNEIPNNFDEVNKMITGPELNELPSTLDEVDNKTTERPNSLDEVNKMITEPELNKIPNNFDEVNKMITGPELNEIPNSLDEVNIPLTSNIQSETLLFESNQDTKMIKKEDKIDDLKSINKELTFKLENAIQELNLLRSQLNISNSNDSVLQETTEQNDNNNNNNNNNNNKRQEQTEFEYNKIEIENLIENILNPSSNELILESNSDTHQNIVDISLVDTKEYKESIHSDEKLLLDSSRENINVDTNNISLDLDNKVSDLILGREKKNLKKLKNLKKFKYIHNSIFQI